MLRRTFALTALAAHIGTCGLRAADPQHGRVVTPPEHTGAHLPPAMGRDQRRRAARRHAQEQR